MSARSRFTMRLSGERRATVRPAFHVPEAMLDFIVEHTEWSDAQAWRWLMDNLQQLADDVSVVMIAGERPETWPLLTKRPHDAEAHGFTVYSGPEISFTAVKS